MSLFQSAVVLFYVILFIISACSFTFAAPKEIIKVTSVSKVGRDIVAQPVTMVSIHDSEHRVQSFHQDISCYHYIMTALLLLADMDDMNERQKKTRVKRDSTGRYSDATKMGVMKLLQLASSFIKNIFAEEPVGGRHPMARSVPGPVVLLFKESIIDNFSPKISNDDE